MVRADGVSAARVEGDPGQLARLVRNLLDNAARHAASIVIVTLNEDGGQAVLRVDDDGRGIPPEDRERVFERFTRVDEGRARRQGGAGLGLSLVSAIAVAHGGTVTASDAPVRRRPLRGPPPARQPLGSPARAQRDQVARTSGRGDRRGARGRARRRA